MGRGRQLGGGGGLLWSQCRREGGSKQVSRWSFSVQTPRGVLVQRTSVRLALQSKPHAIASEALSQRAAGMACAYSWMTLSGGSQQTSLPKCVSQSP